MMAKESKIVTKWAAKMREGKFVVVKCRLIETAKQLRAYNGEDRDVLHEFSCCIDYGRRWDRLDRRIHHTKSAAIAGCIDNIRAQHHRDRQALDLSEERLAKAIQASNLGEWEEVSDES